MVCNFSHEKIKCKGDGYCNDSNQEDQEEAIPCPRCNTETWLKTNKDLSEKFMVFPKNHHLSERWKLIWDGAVALAMRENPKAAQKVIGLIGHPHRGSGIAQ